MRETNANGLSPSPRTRVVNYAFAALGAALLTFALMHTNGRRERLIPENSRKTMPVLALRTLDGSVWRMEDHRGQVVVVNYWATWCEPCWTEIPGLVRLSRELGPQGLSVVGVAMDEGGEDKIRAFVQKFNVTYAIALPQPLSQMAYGLDGLPTTIVVDRKGRAAKIYSGMVREKDLRSDVTSLLKER
jgi:peroxiredoxin